MRPAAAAAARRSRRSKGSTGSICLLTNLQFKILFTSRIRQIEFGSFLFGTADRFGVSYGIQRQLKAALGVEF